MLKKWRVFLSMALVLSALVIAPVLAGPSRALPSLPRPQQHNILIIVADDLGTEVLDCYGQGLPAPPTPNICGLARPGARFTNAWSNPWCSPTRATCQTGRYGFRTGVLWVTFPGGNPQDALPPEEATIAEVLDLANSGYTHAAIGKWHLSNDSNGGADGPNAPWAGYDYYAGALFNLQNYYTWNRTVDGQTDTISYADYQCSVSGTSCTGPAGQCPSGETCDQLGDNAYAPSVNVDDAVAWIDQQTQLDQPWFMWFAFNTPHSPFHAPPEHLQNTYTNAELMAGDISDGRRCPFSPTNTRPDCYKAMVEAMDNEIGRLLSGLPTDRPTTVIFIGDNGTPQPVTELADSTHAKGTMYQGGINVPMLVRTPEITQNLVMHELVNTSDFFSTVLELAGVDPTTILPEDLPLDSVSLVPLLQGTTSTPRDLAYAETYIGQTIRDEQYKLIRFTSTGEFELYNLIQDPQELNDLYVDGANPAVADFDDREAFLNLLAELEFLREELPSCPATHGCTGYPQGSCRPSQLPPTCPVSSTGMTACEQDGELIQCPTDEFVRVQNCPCEAVVPGAICVNESQRWFCD